MLKNADTYFNQRWDLFGDSFLNWLYGFLQNILGKIVSISNIYQNVASAAK